MGAELEGLKFRGEGDQSMGERMVEVAMALMRKVDDRLERMESKLDEIAKERMAEAREAGENVAKVKALEAFKTQHLDDHRWLWRAIVGACITAAGAMLATLFKR